MAQKKAASAPKRRRGRNFVLALGTALSETVMQQLPRNQRSKLTVEQSSKLAHILATTASAVALVLEGKEVTLRLQTSSEESLDRAEGRS